MLMMIVAVVIGVLIAVVILQNPEIIGLLLRFVLIGAVVVVGLILVAWFLFTIWPSSDKAPTKSPASVIKGIKFDDKVINLALEAAPVINRDCTQKVYNKDTALQLQIGDKNYLVLESSCTPEHANQHFSFVNLVEVSPSSGLKVLDSIKSTGSVNALNASNDLVTIDSVEYGPTDPHCCPTVKTTKRYQVKSDKLFLQ